VVPELGGTTTVVVFCGGFGLLLLMHPDNKASMQSEAKTIFMVRSSWVRLTNVESGIIFDHLKALASRPDTAPTVSFILLSQDL
jgi:hypothetical protein